jgi:hypothetical protein
VAQHGQVRIEGWVIDEQTGDPVPSVDLVVRAGNERYIASTVTDDRGQFQLQFSQINAISIYASRIGYADNQTPVLRFGDNDFFRVEIRLDPVAVLLAPLEVLARRKAERSPVLENFDRRVNLGNGYYITRDQIEARRPSLVTDLLATVPGVRVVGSGAGNRRTIEIARAGGRDCPVQIFVDGMLVTRRIRPGFGAPTAGYTIDDVAAPNSVEGIEIYRGLSTVPPEFLTPDADCGVVAIWTRRGG